MSVDGVNNNNNLFTNATQNSDSDSNTLDKDAFLKLLVAEIQNQNPLEPMDNQKFLDQMTQFTTMEQMTNMSESFQGFITQMQSTTKLQASAVVGKYAVIEGNTIKYYNNTAEGIVYNVEEAGEIFIRVTDKEGNLIKEENLGYKEPGIFGYQWDGRNTNGTTQPEGTYDYQMVRINSKGEEETFGGVDGGTVEAVQFIDEDIYVIVNNQKYDFKDIIEISEAPEDEKQT